MFVHIVEYFPDGTGVDPILLGAFTHLPTAMEVLINKAQSRNPDAESEALWWKEQEESLRYLIRSKGSVIFGSIKTAKLNTPMELT